MQEKRENHLLFPRNYTIIVSSLPLWWNWQTRWTQNPVVVIPYRFDPDQRHQKKTWHFMCQVFFCVSGDGVENSFDPARAFGRARSRKGQHTLSEGDARELCERSAAKYSMCQVFFCVSGNGVENSFDTARAYGGARCGKGQHTFSEGDARELCERSSAQYSMCQVFFCVSGDGVENSFDTARAFGGARCTKRTMPLFRRRRPRAMRAISGTVLYVPNLFLCVE